MSSSSTSQSLRRSQSLRKSQSPRKGQIPRKSVKISKTKRELEKLFNMYIKSIYESKEEIKKHKFKNIIMMNVCILDIVEFTNLLIRIYTKIHTLNITVHNNPANKKNRLLIRYLLFIYKNSILEDEILEHSDNNTNNNNQSNKARETLNVMLESEFGKEQLVTLPVTELDEELKHKYICSYILSSKINDLNLLYQSKSFVENANTGLTLLNTLNQEISESLHQKILIHKKNEIDKQLTTKKFKEIIDFYDSNEILLRRSKLYLYFPVSKFVQLYVDGEKIGNKKKEVSKVFQTLQKIVSNKYKPIKYFKIIMHYYTTTLKDIAKSTITETIAENIDTVWQGGNAPGESKFDINFPFPHNTLDCMNLLSNDILHKSNHIKLEGGISHIGNKYIQTFSVDNNVSNYKKTKQRAKNIYASVGKKSTSKTLKLKKKI